MICGIGNDLIEIERVRRACEKQAFMNKVYTDKELELIGHNSVRAAGNFAVKEAVSKVLGTGFSKCAPKEIEVLRDGEGKPYVVLYGNAAGLAADLGINNIYVTISNTKDYALATAIGEAL